jgi:hypothetical protein
MKNILTGIASGGHHGAGCVSVSFPRWIDPSANGQIALQSQPASICGADAPQSCCPAQFNHGAACPLPPCPGTHSSRSGCTLPGAA